MKMQNTFYITTPIYYPSDKLHIGHCYTTIAADVISRYKRMQGYDVMFLTGTDEHGQKIEQAAKKAGETPKEYVDRIVAGIIELWKFMNISNDRFIRTTDDYHELSIQRIFKKLYDSDEIYKGQYTGKYCIPDETFWTESQLKDGKCPDCGREVVDASEEAYFFRLSKYADRLLQHYADNPDFLQPESRLNEMKSFINQGLEDLCVSRTSFKWGVPVDFDENHIVYVWVDALSNYITALGYMNEKYDDFDRYWPADVHLMAKEIIRFHSVIWPALLMAQGIELPKKVYGHGWLLMDGGKMGKSIGNVVDPVVLGERYGVDAIRYYLMREIQFGHDGNFTNESLIGRINSDLANDLGNLVSRTVSMIKRYFDGTLNGEPTITDEDKDIKEIAEKLPSTVTECIDSMHLPQALIEIFRLVSRTNKYIDETLPWKLAEDKDNKNRLATVLYNLSESLRFIAILLSPFMPETSEKILDVLNIPENLRSLESVGSYGVLPFEVSVNATNPLFPRIDLEKELVELESLVTKKDVKEVKAIEHEQEIDYSLFMSSELRVVKVIGCEKVEKADKLLKFTVEDGERQRTIVSGIAQWYSPEDVIGKKIAAVLNLKPAKIRGIISEGMLLSSDIDRDGIEEASLLFIEDTVPEGSRIR